MATSTLPSEHITPKSLYTITGAAAAVWLFGAVLYTVLGPKIDEVFYRAIAFGLSIIIAVGMLIEKKTFKLKYWLLVIPNSALIFVNASGYNAVNTGSPSTPGVDKDNSTSSGAYFTSPVEQPSMQRAAFLPFLKDIAWWPDPTLNQKIEQLEETNDSLLNENRIMKNKIAENIGDASGSAADRQKITFLEDQVKLLQEENTALRAVNNSTDLTTAIGGLKKELADKSNQLRDCNSELQKMKIELASVNKQLSSCLSKTNPSDALNSRITSVTNQLAQAKNDLVACERKLKDCNSKPGDPDGSPVVLALNDRIKNLQADLASAKSDITKCRTALDQANSRNSGTDQTALINDLRSKLNSYSGDLEKCNSELRKYQGYYKTCTGQLGSVRDSLNRCLNPKQIIRTQIPNRN